MKPSRDSLVGQLLDGRYLVTDRIARGGMATVYLATDNRLDRDVAIKVMHPHLADDPQFVARFHREAKAAARMAHSNAVAVFDQGQQGDVVYLVMEYVPGTTLRDLITERGALTVGETLEVLEPLLEALSAAHRAGLVHRDIKPENVLITGDGRVKVADFGLARAANVSHSSATTGMLLGTFAYLSPEQVTRGIADARSDIYAVGIVTFEMLTGQQPFAGALPGQILFNNVSMQVPAPSTLDPGLPTAVDELVTWATDRDPDLRPHDATELANLVRQLHGRLTDSELDREPQPRPRSDDPHGLAATPTAPQATRVEPRPNRFDDGDDATVALGPFAGAGSQSDDERSGPSFHAAPEPSDRDGVRSGHTPDRDGHDPDHDDQEGHRRRRSVPIVLVLVLVLALAGGAGWFFTAGPGAYTTTPAVTGTADAAGKTLANAGLSMKESEEYSESVETGQVIRTDPRAGQKVRKQGTVEVFVSAGSAYTETTDIVDYSPEGATKRLKADGLTLGETTGQEYSDEIDKGNIISQNPKAGERIRRGTGVSVVLSKGPAPIDVPTVTGQPEAEARGALEGLGLKVDTATEYNDTTPKGQVISQSPDGGTLYRGDRVKLVLSDGPQPVPVPNVINQKTTVATQALEAAGFKVEVRRVFGGGLDTVRSQSPSGGQAPKGSTVTITVV